jgi:NAD(P)-dependent dehydrogenase (short-subunit alcohol dehydrogenase family)
LAGRDLVKIQPLIVEIHKLSATVKVDLVQLDLASFDSIRKAAKEIADLADQIHYVFNNAGIMATKNFTKTLDGIEAQFAINHVGHFLLTGLLLPLITKAAATAAASGDHSLPVRIINITSNGYIFQGIRFNDYNFQNGKKYDPWLGYGQAKSANIIFSKVLSTKLHGFNATSFAATPGLVLETNLQSTVDRDVWASVGEAYDKAWEGRDKPPLEEPKPLAFAASTPLRAALDPTLSSTPGEYLMDCKIMDESAKLDHIRGNEIGEKLWELSEKLVGQGFSVK